MDEVGQALRAEGHRLVEALNAEQLQMAIAFLARLAERHAEYWDPLGTLFGIQDEGRGQGVASCSLSVGEIHRNPMGLAHGCVAFALADFGMGYALKTVIKPEQWSASQEVSIRFLRPVRRARLLCRSQVLDVSGNLARVQSEVLNGSGQPVAQVRGTYRLFESGRRSVRLAPEAASGQE